MKVTFLAAFAVGFALLFGGTAMAHGGAVFTQTNSPAGNAGAEYAPSFSDFVCRVKPVALLRTVIGASLMIAPDGSVTMPEIVPTGACAQRTDDINTLNRTPSDT